MLQDLPVCRSLVDEYTKTFHISFFPLFKTHAFIQTQLDARIKENGPLRVHSP
jgi:hypothetical protein